MASGDARRARGRLPGDLEPDARRERDPRRAPRAGRPAAAGARAGVAPRAAHAAAKARALRRTTRPKRSASAPRPTRQRRLADAVGLRRALPPPPAAAQRRASATRAERLRIDAHGPHRGLAARDVGAHELEPVAPGLAATAWPPPPSSTAPVSATMGCGASGAAGRSKTVRAASKPSVATGDDQVEPPGRAVASEGVARRRGRRCQRTSNVKLPRISARGSSIVMRTVWSSRRAACASSERPSSATIGTSGSSDGRRVDVDEVDRLERPADDVPADRVLDLRRRRRGRRGRRRRRRLVGLLPGERAPRGEQDDQRSRHGEGSSDVHVG